MSTTNSTPSVEPLSIGEVAQRSQLIRGRRVILDTDLAAFYGETTKRLNQQVTRNQERFPEDFMFHLNKEEFPDQLQGLPRWSRLCTTAMSVHVVRAFVALRSMLSSNRELAAKVHTLERKVSIHERNISELVESMAELLAAPPTPPNRSIGFLPVDGKTDKAASVRASSKVARKRLFRALPTLP